MDATHRHNSDQPETVSYPGYFSAWHRVVIGMGLGAALVVVILLKGDFVSARAIPETKPPSARLLAPQLGTSDTGDVGTNQISVPALPLIIPRSAGDSSENESAPFAAQQSDPASVPGLAADTPQLAEAGRSTQTLDLQFDAVEDSDSGFRLRNSSSLNVLTATLSRQEEENQPPTEVPPAPILVPEPVPAETQERATPLLSEPASGPRPRRVYVGGHVGMGAYPGVSRFRANNECDARAWMGPYQYRAHRTTPNAMDAEMQPAAQLDPRYTAWWDGLVRSSTGMAPQSVPVRLADLVQKSLFYSPQVLAIKTEPHVQYHVVGQEEARFDWSVFLETTWDDLKDPVGNELALGIPGEDRLSDRNLRSAFGLRRRNRHGGEFEVSQRFGHQRQNSVFFTPNPQGSSRLELRYRQPLLNGAGAVVNESEIVLARITANASEDEVVGGLQEHLVQVTEAYWTLYRARAEFFQRQKLLQSSEGVLRKLIGRSEVDSTPRQILRAKAAVARAQTSIQRTLSRVRDAEAQLRLLVNSPELLNTGMVELIPQVCPTAVSDPTELRASLDFALQNRPDISEAIRQMRSSGVRLGVSRNELLPRLDFIVSSYVSDITGTSLPDSVYGQFTDARPSYILGIEFEVPLGNRAARAQLEQRKWELKRSINVFRATVEKALTDVEIAHREVATAWSEVLSGYEAMNAAQNEASYLQDRFDVLPMSESSAILLLEDLLDAFERVADEESAFVQAQVTHAISIIQLRQEVGTLLRTRESRPQLDAEQAQWMSRRVQSTTAAESVRRAGNRPAAGQDPQPVVAPGL